MEKIANENNNNKDAEIERKIWVNWFLYLQDFRREHTHLKKKDLLRKSTFSYKRSLIRNKCVLPSAEVEVSIDEQIKRQHAIKSYFDTLKWM